MGFYHGETTNHLIFGSEKGRFIMIHPPIFGNLEEGQVCGRSSSKMSRVGPRDFNGFTTYFRSPKRTLLWVKKLTIFVNGESSRMGGHHCFPERW